MKQIRKTARSAAVWVQQADVFTVEGKSMIVSQPVEADGSGSAEGSFFLLTGFFLPTVASCCSAWRTEDLMILHKIWN